MVIELTVPPWAKDDPELWDLEKMEQARPLAIEVLQEASLVQIKEQHTELMGRLKTAFDAFDLDGSGNLSKDEVLVILTRMTGEGQQLSEQAQEA